MKYLDQQAGPSFCLSVHASSNHVLPYIRNMFLVAREHGVLLAFTHAELRPEMLMPMCSASQRSNHAS